MNSQSDNKSFTKALLDPSSIGLVGASGDIKKNTARPLRFMRKHDFAGKIFPINPSRTDLNGDKCYPSLAAVGEPVEHVFVMVPGAQVFDVLDDCAAAGVKVVTVYSDGFAESGDAGREQQERLIRKARSLGLRILGPNSIGTANIHSGGIISVNATFEADNLVSGDISLVSQSGSMMGSFLSRAAARGFGFAKSFSVGNEADITVGEIIDALVDDEQTHVILLFLETIRDASGLAHALNRAHQAGKPVIAYKLGRSEQGNELAQSHTGALAGNDAAVDAFLRAHGVMRVHYLETLFELVPLARRYMAAPAPKNKPRVAVITTTGGGAATVVDSLGLMGVDAVSPPADFIQHMARRGLKIKQSAIIDLTLAATSAQYKDLLEQILQADWCDAVLSVVGSSAQFHPELAVRPITDCIKQGNKPLAVFLSPNAPESLRVLQSYDIAAFRTPEGCADALACFLKRSYSADSALSTDEQAFEWPLPDHAQPGMLSEHKAGQVMKALNVELAESVLVPVDDLQHDLPYPVVVKVCSADIPHKTEVGGIKVSIRNSQELESNAREILGSVTEHAPDAVIEGFLVQKMEKNLIELILGYRFDPQVGPTVLLGAGGVTAELMKDFSIRRAPVDTNMAHEMIKEVKLTQLVRGFRGLPQADIDQLAQTISNFSRLANVKGAFVEEAEINPLFVQQDKVIGVDALLRLGSLSGH